jgi:site-specific DNA-methyltransferase (adenine-specific)
MYRSATNNRPPLPLFQPPEEARSEPYRHGNATLFHTEALHWLGEREPHSIEAVVTDPPYGLHEYSPAQQQKLRARRGGVWRIPPAFDGHQRSPLPRFTTLKPDQLAQLDTFFHEWARKLRPCLVPGAHVFVASSPLLSYIVAGAVSRAGMERRGEVIRLTSTLRGGDRPKGAHEKFPEVSVMPRSQWEPWLLFREPLEGRVQDNLKKWKTGALRRPCPDKPFGDVIPSAPTRGVERALAPHPSLKPQAFLRQIVRAALPLREGTILDPFAGSGSTLAAAQSLGYRSIGLENDPEYFAIACDAIPKLADYAPASKNGNGR